MMLSASMATTTMYDELTIEYEEDDGDDMTKQAWTKFAERRRLFSSVLERKNRQDEQELESGKSFLSGLIATRESR